jgi:hypothetical protein
MTINDRKKAEAADKKLHEKLIKMLPTQLKQ